jgi:hypothetical protein
MKRREGQTLQGEALLLLWKAKPHGQGLLSQEISVVTRNRQ